LSIQSKARVDPLALAIAELLGHREAQERIREDPVRWVRDVLHEDPWPRQEEIIRSVFSRKRVAVKSAHSVGKTRGMAMAALAFYYAFDDSIVVTTGPTARQVEVAMWGYIRSMHARAMLPGNLFKLKLEDTNVVNDQHKIIGFTATTSEQFQGIHAPHVLVIVDEASGIDPDIAVGIEATLTGQDPHLVLIGNPTQTSGYFFDAFNSQRHLYHPITLSAKETPEYAHPGSYPYLPSREWVDERAQVWGEESPLFKIRVLGEFAHDETNGVIPLSWVEAANRRWELQAGDSGFVPLDRMDSLGVDVGLSHDESVLAPRVGHTITELRKPNTGNTLTLADIVTGMVKAHGGIAVVDAIGIGTGVVESLQRAGIEHVAFVASQKSTAKDRTRELGFSNKRSEMWWHLREMLDPVHGEDLALPPDEKLTYDLITPTYDLMPGGKIRVEDKEHIRKRLGRSTDAGDAVAMAFWMEGRSFQDLMSAYAQSCVVCDYCGNPITDTSLTGDWAGVSCQYCGIPVDPELRTRIGLPPPPSSGAPPDAG